MMISVTVQELARCQTNKQTKSATDTAENNTTLVTLRCAAGSQFASNELQGCRDVNEAISIRDRGRGQSGLTI